MHHSYKHGLTNHPLYQTWYSMVQRCTNKRWHNFSNYGGRGITVCERWLDVRSFVRDLPPRPPGMTLERKNNNGPYNRRNCVWATRKVQLRNKRTNRLIRFRGRTQTIAGWAEELNLPYGKLYNRVATHGWTMRRAIAAPFRKSPAK